MKDWSKSQANRFPLNQDELMTFAHRRWNYGIFDRTYFSIHPVRSDHEITENYGDLIYNQAGLISGMAEIEDNSESVYMPATYKIKNVDYENDIEIELNEIISYEGLFCDMFRNGEAVKFKGVLERVEGIKKYNRVVIGSAGSFPGYIKPAKVK
jgi:predicted nucleotidyltransferase